MASIAGIGMILAIVFTLLFFPGFIILQIFLSKRANKVVGLIIPIVSFVTAMLFTLVISGCTMYAVETSSQQVNVQIEEYAEEYDGETEIIDDAEEYNDTASEGSSDTIAVVPIIFIITNIPTVIYLLIYFVCRAKIRKKLKNSPQKQLEKMNIQDLG